MSRQLKNLRRLAFTSNHQFSSLKPHCPRYASDQASSESPTFKTSESHDHKTSGQIEKEKKLKKTMAELDEELRLKLEGHDSEGGEAGLELEGGKAVSMKRGVRENMFRYI